MSNHQSKSKSRTAAAPASSAAGASSTSLASVVGEAAGGAPRGAKAKLLDAALHEFRVRGYAATTVDDICAAAGVTKGSFFHHFVSKEELAIAGADHFAAMAAGLFASAPYHAPADPLERVLGYVDFRAQILRGELPEFTCYMGTLVQETYSSHPALREVCKKHIGEHAAEVAKDIALAKARCKSGDAKAGGWTPEGLGLFTQAVLQGAFVLAKAHGGPEVAVECAGHLRRYIELLMESESQRGRELPKE